MNAPRSRDPRALFSRAGERLDAPMAARLRAARREALAGGPRRGGAWRPWLPAGGLAAAVLALGLAWWLPSPAPTPARAAPAVTGETLEDLAVEEDAEFYAWLAEAPVATGDGPL